MKFFAALAVVALFATLVAVGMTAGTTQAQNANNTYAGPQPCGPRAGVAYMAEPHEVTEGHIVLFDAYWEWTEQWTNDANPNEGIMHTNECPPKMAPVWKDDGFGNLKETISRTASGIDLGEAIMHVKDGYLVTVVATNADVTESRKQLSLEEYPEVGSAAPVGSKVYWLRLDDPNTTGADEDETSALSIGFSTALFDDKYWLTRKDEQPMRYMLETAGYRDIEEPAEAPHFFAYEAPPEGNEAQAALVLDSTNPDVTLHDMVMDPGEYRALQWIFTKPGTYELSSHLQGFVRHEKPLGAGDDWKPISTNVNKTSDVRDYVFQVGEALDETEPPMFGVDLSAHQDADAGTKVGEPVRVFGLEVPGPIYTLSGERHDHFTVDSRTHPNAAQIVVASNDGLSSRSYDLVLGVSDGKDHEGNNDDSIDHSIAVEIDVILDTLVYITTEPRHPTPTVGESVTLTLNMWDLPESVPGQDVEYSLLETNSAGVATTTGLTTDETSFAATTTLTKDSAGTYKYTPIANFTFNGVTRTVHGDPVTITWRNP